MVGENIGEITLDEVVRNAYEATKSYIKSPAVLKELFHGESEMGEIFGAKLITFIEEYNKDQTSDDKRINLTPENKKKILALADKEFSNIETAVNDEKQSKGFLDKFIEALKKIVGIEVSSKALDEQSQSVAKKIVGEHSRKVVEAEQKGQNQGKGPNIG